MTPSEALHGLNCPNCGGMLPIPEGQILVHCPYCEMRSFVRGERGLRRYQVPQRIQRQNAADALRRFFSSSWAIARDAARQSRLEEVFLVYLPFWTVWGRVAGWAFGEVKKGSGDNTRYEPREVKIIQEMTWNGAACDVGEFGVGQIPLADQSMEAFDPEALHLLGLVFEPVNAFSQARAAAEQQFQDQVRRKAGLDRLAQLFVRTFRSRFGLIYYPLWVLRYLYHGRAFQVVVDGYSGKVLYGKAPGNTLYRAAALVVGMALGAFLAVDVAAFALTLTGNGDDDGGIGLTILLFLAGLALMVAAYRAFRYGEQFEYRQGGRTLLQGLSDPMEMITTGMSSVKVKDVEQWINRLS